MAMKTMTVLLCDTCEKPILHKEDGFLLHGAIFQADINTEPLAGMAVPNKPTIATKDVSFSAFCKTCFAQKLGLHAAATPQVLAHANIPGARGAELPAPTILPDGTKVIDLTNRPQGAPVVGPNGATVGAVVHTGSTLPTGNIEALPSMPGPVRPGDTVRMLPGHRFYAALKGRAARVERFREESNDFALVLANGQPMLAKPHEVEKIG